jgi:uncharacterized protein
MKVRLLAFIGCGLITLSAAAHAPEAWQDQLSQPTYADIRFRMFQVAMPDGVKLSAALWRPDIEGVKFPVILVATPYSKLRESFLKDSQFYSKRGYAYVTYDLRGRYDSQGSSYLYGAQDGNDLDVMMSWAATQPWSNGKIAMYGGSYHGFIQWEGALKHNPHLAALIPEVSPDDHYDNIYPSGAMQLSNSLALLQNCCGGHTNVPSQVMDWEKWYRHLPLKDLASYAGIQNTNLWNDLLANTQRTPYWPGVGERIAPGKLGAGKYDQVKVPTYNISGWYDQVSQATINNYMGMVAHGPKELRGSHRLLMGPWTHGGLFKTKQGDITFPAQAAPNGDEFRLRWFDMYMKGIDSGFGNEEPVKIYVMGADRWRGECEWPLERTKYTNYYLHSGGRANSLLGDGDLSTAAPGDEHNDAFVYNPNSPVPTLGGNVNMNPSRVGAYDQTAIELRSDVLVYTTSPLEEDVEVTGPVIVKLFAATDRTDTDFTGKLIDVDPDGYARILLEGIIRGRFNKSFREQNLLTQHQVTEFYIDLWSTSNLFRKGHRIRIEVSSSNFPKYDRNPNTGHAFGADAEMVPAHQQVFHDRRYPSHVILPVIPAGSGPCQARTVASRQN